MKDLQLYKFAQAYILEDRRFVSCFSKCLIIHSMIICGTFSFQFVANKQKCRKYSRKAYLHLQWAKRNFPLIYWEITRLEF